MQAIYWVRQGLNNLSASAKPEDWTLVDRYLAPVERSLFAAMEIADQRHCVGVLRSLLSEGISDTALLKAGLLHDVGKARCRIGVLHRSIAVLLVALFGKLPSFLTRQCQEGFCLPFYVLENHPRIGAAKLAKAGCEERGWRLTELHQLDPAFVGNLPDDEWVRWARVALRAADSKNGGEGAMRQGTKGGQGRGVGAWCDADTNGSAAAAAGEAGRSRHRPAAGRASAAPW